MTKTSKISAQYNYATLNRKIIAFGINIVIITRAADKKKVVRESKSLL
jgi:hypothetical protein